MRHECSDACRFLGRRIAVSGWLLFCLMAVLETSSATCSAQGNSALNVSPGRLAQGPSPGSRRGDRTRGSETARVPNRISNGQAGPRDYRSRNFLLHSDLPKSEAESLLERLEAMLALISKYWGKPNREPLECFVVRDLSVWPPDAMPPQGRQKVQTRSGVTITVTTSERRSGQVLAAKAVVYATADGGVAQHEVVHAYCGQNFGRTGPVWYSEGMAEMGLYWKSGESQVNCIPEAVTYIRNSPPKPLGEIVYAREISGDGWENYCWRWALCHLLANNPNYYDRFRPLGLGLLLNQPDSDFDKVYGTMAREIDFEYQFFLQHLDLGYEVTLTSWDWKSKFRHIREKQEIKATVLADRGWQASRLEVRSGEKFAVTAKGSWQVESDGVTLNANGEEVPAESDVASDKKDGTDRTVGIIPYEPTGRPGQLIGVLFRDYELSEPFEIPVDGQWTASTDGQLFLRCEDAWNQLADNKGRVSVEFVRVASSSAP